MLTSETIEATAHAAFETYRRARYRPLDAGLRRGRSTMPIAFRTRCTAMAAPGAARSPAGRSRSPPRRCR